MADLAEYGLRWMQVTQFSWVLERADDRAVVGSVGYSALDGSWSGWVRLFTPVPVPPPNYKWLAPAMFGTPLELAWVTPGLAGLHAVQDAAVEVYLGKLAADAERRLTPRERVHGRFESFDD